MCVPVLGELCLFEGYIYVCVCMCVCVCVCVCQTVRAKVKSMFEGATVQLRRVGRGHCTYVGVYLDPEGIESYPEGR